MPGDPVEALGRVESIHVAKGARLPMQSKDAVDVEAGKGIVGDRYHGTRHRHVTVQTRTELEEAAAEHGGPIAPRFTRRNVTLAAGRLDRTPGARMTLGPVELEVVRDAAPCKLLEDELGRDARLALHRRAGVVCRVLVGGRLTVGAPAERAPADG